MNRQSVYVKVIWSVFSEGFLSSRRAFGSSPQRAFAAVSLTLLTFFLLSGFKTEHKPLCLPWGNSPRKPFSHTGIKGRVHRFCCAILLLGCWFVLLHILKSLTFYEEDTLCMCLFLMSVLFIVNGFYHKNIQKFVQTMMQRYSAGRITTSP